MSRGRDWSLLRGADPVAGDPVALHALADRYLGTAEAADRAYGGLEAVVTSRPAWRSLAGLEFSWQVNKMSWALKGVGPRYLAMGQALHRYARELQDVQDDADAVLVRAQRAHDEREAADRAWRSQDDPALRQLHAERAEAAQRRLDDADRRLQELEGRWWRIGAAAADAIEEVTSADGLDDSRFDLLGVVESVSDAAATLSVALAGAALVAAVVPGGQPIAAALGVASAVSGVTAVVGQGVLVTQDRATTEEFLTGLAGTLVGLASAGVGRLVVSTAAQGAATTGQAVAGTARTAAPPAARAFDALGNAVPVGQSVHGSRQSRREPGRPHHRAGADACAV